MPGSVSRIRWQFNLRWLFYATLAASIPAFLSINNGLAEAIGVGVAFALAGLAVALPDLVYRSAARGLIGLVAALAVWGVGVDRSMYWVGCEHCHSHWYEVRYRVFGRPVASWKGDDHSPTIKRIAEDLGAPCPHDYRAEMRTRQWGIVFYCHPCFAGTCCLGDVDWYTDEVRPKVRQLGRRQPDLGQTLRIGLERQNLAVVRRVIAEVHQSTTTASDQ